MKTAVDLYIESGPINSQSETISGGNYECELAKHLSEEQEDDLAFAELVSGKKFSIKFALPEKIEGLIGRYATVNIKFHKRKDDAQKGKWIVVQPDGSIQTEDINYNFGSGEIANKLVSVRGVVFNFDEDDAQLFMTKDTCLLNKKGGFKHVKTDFKQQHMFSIR